MLGCSDLYVGGRVGGGGGGDGGEGAESFQFKMSPFSTDGMRY